MTVVIETRIHYRFIVGNHRFAQLGQNAFNRFEAETAVTIG